MIGERFAFAVGMFVIPAVLLWAGHHFREGSLRRKRMFWGGVIGHSLALLITLTAAMAPPVLWTGGGVLRDLAIYWSLLIGAAIGAAFGAMKVGNGR